MDHNPIKKALHDNASKLALASCKMQLLVLLGCCIKSGCSLDSEERDLETADIGLIKVIDSNCLFKLKDMVVENRTGHCNFDSARAAECLQDLADALGGNKTDCEGLIRESLVEKAHQDKLIAVCTHLGFKMANYKYEKKDTIYHESSAPFTYLLHLVDYCINIYVEAFIVRELPDSV